MTPSRVVRSLLLFVLLLALPTFAFAATTEFRVLFDTDSDSTTGCKVGSFEGVEQVLVTQVANDDTTPQVNRTFRQLCVAGALGAPTGEVTTGWPSVFRSGDRLLTLETRLPFSAFGSGMPESVHVGFDVTRNAASQQALVDIDGSPVFVPAAPRRRHAVGDSGDRMITLDGALLDWGAIKPVISGIVSDGSQALRMIRVYSFSNPVDSYMYFAAQVRASSETPFADDDLYEREAGSNLNVTAANGVLKNDGDPHGLPLTATKVSEPHRGSVTLNPDGSFTYSPNNQASQLGDEFEYQSMAGTTASNVARVFIKINNGEAPAGPPRDDAYATNEDKTLVVDPRGVLENDPDGQNLAAALQTPPSHGTVTLNADGGFTYKPTINFFGTDTFVYSATRVTSNKNIGTATVTIEVARVNDPPSFTPGGNITRPANAGPYSAIWATNIVPGPSNENGQLVTFVVTNNNNGLFSVQPAISSNGTLTFTPTGSLGSATVTVFAQDNGGTANGGDNTSDPVTFTITITCPVITVTKPATTTATVGTAFSQTFTQSGAVGTATFTTGSTLPAGLSLSTTGVLSGTPTQPGTFPIVVTVTDSNGCTGVSTTYTLVVSCQTITVNNPGTSTGTAGSPFSQTFTQSGALGGATFTTSSTLPAGLSLATNGTLSGTPTQTGSFPIVVTVTDGNGCTGTGSTYTLVIGCQTITVTNPGASSATANSPFSATFTQSGGIGTTTFTLASGVLPAGITLAANGTLSGTPTQTGSFPITVKATDSNGCQGTGATYTLVVGCQTITVNNPANSNGTANAAFSETFTATNTIGTTTFTLASGTLPAGMTLAANGTLSGTPTQTGSFPITVTATDANGCQGTGPVYNIVIACQTITVTNPVNTTGTVSSPFSEQFTQTGAIGTATFSTASTLPAGLSLSSTGLLSGTPTQNGTFPITVTVTDSNGCTGTSATYTLIINCQVITVTNPANATGPAGSPFSETFTQTGAVGTATFTLASGTLPTGITLAANGVLAGTPTQNGSFPITVTVTDSNGCTGTSATYTLVITCQTITVTNPANGNGTANSLFSETFTQSGALGTATFSLASGSLPTGLSLSSTGVLSGTPTQTGSFPITVMVTDSNGCTGTGPTYTIVIACQTITVTNPANANGTANSAFSETFTQTGAIGSATFSLATGTLPAGLTLAANGVVSGTPTVTGSFPITVTVTDSNGCTGTSATYTIVIACQTITVNNPANANGTASSPFSETFTSSNGIGTMTYTLASGVLPSGLTLATNGTLSGTPTQTGSFPITVTATDSNSCTGTSATYNLTIACQTITVTPPANGNGTASSPFSETFTQSGAIGTATFTLASGTLPTGLTLATNGVVSGTPTQTGSFPITVTVTDSNSCTGTSATYTIVIACQTITVTNPSNATGPAGSPFSETFTQTGAIGTATFTLASGSLPTGLSLAANGTLSGTPTQGGSFPITVTVTDSNGCTGTGSTYTIVITCPVITVNNPANANGTANSAFSETFSQSGGQGTITYSLASGSLPAGLSLAANGTLSGTPTQVGSFPITVTATDQNGCTGTGSTYTIVIGCQTISVTNPATTTGTANSPFSQTFTQTGGIGTTTFSLASGVLPAGLTLASNGTLSGTPTQVGSFPITVTATDSNGCTGTGATYNLTIGCQTITVTNPATTTGTINVAFSETFTQSGAIGSATFTTASTLPNGLTLATNGTLSGTPTQVGTFPIVVTVTDSNGCTGTSATYNLVINCQTITVTSPSNANGTVGTVFTETFTQSGANGTVTWSLDSGTLPAGLSLNTSSGVISGTPTQSGNFPITVKATDVNGCFGTSSTYTIVIACQTITVTNPGVTTGTVDAAFSQTFTQTGGIGTTTFSTSSTLPAGLTLASNGTLSGTPGAPGTFNITVVATDSNGCTGTSSNYQLVIACQTITVTNPGVTTGTVDAAFSQTFTQTGVGTHTPITWSVSGALPSGITLNPSTGVLSGTPGQPGSFPITVTATDANGCSGTGATYTLVIACQTITVTNPGVTSATYNVAFSQTFTQTGVGTHTPVTWSVTGTLPTGITMNGANGNLSGTPTQTGTFPITVTVTDANGCQGTGATYTLAVAPKANDDSYSNAAANTQFVLTGGTTATPSTPTIQIAGTIETNDLPSAATVTVTAGTFGTTNGGSVTIAADGTFLYTPPAQPTVAFTASDTFTYTVSSNTGGVNPVTSAPATVTVNIANRVWYVKNDSAAGGDGRSNQPFDTLVEAQTASTANDIIYVYFGSGSNTGQNAGFTMKTGQKLYGQGIALVVNTQTLVTAGSQPLIGNSAGDGVTATNLTGNIIRGLNITGSDDGISMNTSGATAGDIEIADNTVNGTVSMGIRIAQASTATTSFVSIHDNTLSGTISAMDITRTNGALTIVAFDDLTVPGTSNGGIAVTGTGGVITFDVTPGGTIQPVAGGVTAIGSSGDRINSAGLVLNNVAGTLNYSDLDIFTDSGNALLADGGGAGFTFTVTASNSSLVANAGGAALLTDITALDLQLAAMTSSNAAAEGVLLANITGTFSAPNTASITNATGTDFSVSGGTVASTYNGTITDDLGTLVSLTGGTGGLKSFTGLISDGFDGDGSGITISGNNASTSFTFSGGLSLATGNNAAFSATGAGTLTITDPAGATSNRISTLNGTALSVSGGVQIGASGLTFESIAVDGNDTLPTNGILLNGTGSAGGLTVTSTGSGLTGGLIQDTGDDAISLTNVAKISLTRMNITSNKGSGIFGSGVNGFVVADSQITSNGDDAAADESGIIITGLSGTNGGANATSITNTTISNNWEFELSITNNGAESIGNLTMSGNAISANGLQPNHGNLFNFLSFGSGAMTLNLTSGSFTGNTDTSGGKIITATALQCDHSGSGGTMTCNVSNATFTNNNVGPQGSVAANGQLVVDFNTNNIQGSRAHGVNIFADANAPYTKTIQGRIRNNIIGSAGTVDSGAATGFPIRVQNEGRINVTLVINNNQIFQSPNAGINLNHGISTANGTNTSALTITSNSINNITASRGLILNQNDIIGGGTHGTVCVDVSGNSFASIAGQAGDGSFMRLRKGAQTGGTATFNVTQTTPTPAAQPAQLDDANGFNDTSKISLSGSPTFNAGACAQPSN